MTDHPSAETRTFREAEPLSISSEVTVSLDLDGDYDWIVLRDADPNGPTFLDINDARALRDWLNKVLP